jgi:hypothetical protein
MSTIREALKELLYAIDRHQSLVCFQVGKACKKSRAALAAPEPAQLDPDSDDAQGLAAPEGYWRGFNRGLTMRFAQIDSERNKDDEAELLALAERALAAQPAAEPQHCAKCRNPDRCDERGCQDKAATAPAPRNNPPTAQPAAEPAADDLGALIRHLEALADPQQEATPSYENTDWRGLANTTAHELQRLRAENESLKANIAAFSGYAPRLDALVTENEALKADAERYRWLRDKSVPPHNFYLSVPIEFDGVRYTPAEVDAAIDAAIDAVRKP